LIYSARLIVFFQSALPAWQRLRIGYLALAPQGGAERRFVAFAGRLRVEQARAGCLRRGNA